MKKKILFIFTNYSTFVKTDFEILSSEYEVVKYQFKPVKGIAKTAFQFFKQKVFLLFNIWKFDAVYIWFADYHSLLPVLYAKILRKKSFVVIGGYDICRIRNLNYGVFVSRFRGFFAYFSMKFCTCNLTVSKFVDRRVKWILPESKRQMIYNSVRIINDEKSFCKKDLVLTVGLIDNEQTFFRKGIDTFIEVARKTPEFEFIIVGVDIQKYSHLLQNLPSNLNLFKKVNQTELIKYYKEAKIYAQFSRMDTFCLTLAEAMIFGCFPIITNEGGMPEVVGKSGKIVKREPQTIAITIRQLQMTKEVNTRITNQVTSNFMIENRKILLLKTVLNSLKN